MSSTKSVLDKALDLLPPYRRLKEKSMPKISTDGVNINFDSLGIRSGKARKDIKRVLDIKAHDDIIILLRNPHKQKITHKNMVLYYLNQKTTSKFLSELAELLLISELKRCKDENINLCHAGYSNIKQIKQKYPNLTKYTRFSELRNTIVKPAIERHKEEFAKFSAIFPVQEVLNLYKQNSHMQYMKEHHKYLHILNIFKIWLRYKDTAKVHAELETLKEYFNKGVAIYDFTWCILHQ